MLGTRGDIRPAISIQVGDDDVIRTAPVLLEDVARPLLPRVTLILEPGYAAGVAPGGRGNIHVAVQISVWISSTGIVALMHRICEDDDVQRSSHAE